MAAHVPVPYEESRSMASPGIGLSREAPKEFIAHDTRKSTQHPLRHAVINTIRKVADFAALSNDRAKSDALETRDQSSDGNERNYLLTSLTLFTTHEPCVMCSMALLHSRVKEVIYLYPMPQTGACGSITCLPALKGVNHRYSIAQWKLSRPRELIGIDNEKILKLEATVDA